MSMVVTGYGYIILVEEGSVCEMRDESCLG
jgi:hypothetical protein